MSWTALLLTSGVPSVPVAPLFPSSVCIISSLEWRSRLCGMVPDIFQAGETHRHRWRFPRFGLPGETPSNLPPVCHSVTADARLRSPRCPRGRTSPVLCCARRSEDGGRDGKEGDLCAHRLREHRSSRTPSPHPRRSCKWTQNNNFRL